ncbi:MAG: DNA cytosine methyltransferase [Clostridium sp.]|uniref:DNA cytosine methyltransferase n=1 Tax=Clostridium sp. TaxID=1506 RepID=UPI003EE46B74
MRGGKREGSGRKNIKGKEYRIKIEDNKIEQLSMCFLGKNVNDKIRECIDYGLKKVKEQKQVINKNKKITVLDLFSGAGGLSRGFLDAGYDVVLGVDFDDMALKTFKENHGSAEAMKLDLFNHENINQIIEYLENKNIKIDVLVGGPPCQGFSLAGSRNKDDERNTLYTAMVKTAQILKPRAIVLENVPGLITLYGGIAGKNIMKDFTELGYKIKAQVLYAPEYGVPQIRKRVFFVALLDSEEEFEFPKPKLTENEFVSCEDAIGELDGLEDNVGAFEQEYKSEPRTEYQKFMRKNSKKLYNHMATKHTEKTIKLISMVPEGKNYKALPEEYREQFNFNEALTRYHSKKPSRTIDTGHRTHFHYKYNRIPSVRENARLQSFPDDFIFYGNKQQQYKQVGNAVPPLLGYHLAKQIKIYLEKSEEEDSEQN